jgi:hypothetical protein
MFYSQEHRAEKRSKRCGKGKIGVCPKMATSSPSVQSFRSAFSVCSAYFFSLQCILLERKAKVGNRKTGRGMPLHL